MFKINVFGNACMRIVTSDIKILCDPWFTPGAYDGSWVAFPEMEDPISKIGDVDIIYVSHIHPDHYDPVFLKKYFDVYGVKKIIIPSLDPNFLMKKAFSDGIEVEEAESLVFNKTFIDIFPAKNDGGSDIDSAILISREKKALLNLNDCVWGDIQSENIFKTIKERNLELELMAASYTGAGPYPQTYYSPSRELETLAKNHAQGYIQKYLQYKEYFKPKKAMPFASGYLLAGKNSHLNKYRSTIDAIEVKQHDPECLILKNHIGEYDIETGVSQHERSEPHSVEDKNAAIEKISSNKLAYEIELNMTYDSIKWFPLMNAAYSRAHSRSVVENDYYFVIDILDDGVKKGSFVINANKHDRKLGLSSKEDLKYSQSSFSKISIDYRLLYGLLTGLYHWNNAEVGSLYSTRREAKFNVDAQNFLNFFSII